ncbi:5239_t:CDS:2, partial [Entrophospora sp. SA101]
NDIKEWIDTDDLLERPPPTPLDTLELFEYLKILLSEDNAEIPDSTESSLSHDNGTTSD